MAKGLRDFARTHPQLVIKGGVLDGKFLEPDEVRKLADLESREVLLAKVAGGMKGILQQAISLISAPLSKTARLLAALEEAAKENPSLIAGPGEPSTADLAAEDTSEPTECREDSAAERADRRCRSRTTELAAAAAGTEPAATAATPEATVAAGDSTTAPAAEDN